MSASKSSKSSAASPSASAAAAAPVNNNQRSTTQTHQARNCSSQLCDYYSRTTFFSVSLSLSCSSFNSLHQLWDSFRQAFKQVKAAGTLLAVQDPLMELFNIVKAIRDLTATKQQQAHADKAKLKEKLNKLIEEKVILRKNQKPVAKGCRCGLVGNAAKICIDCVCVKLNRDCGEYCGCQHGKEDRCQRNNPAEVDDEQQEYELFFVSDNDEEMVFNDEEEQEVRNTKTTYGLQMISRHCYKCFTHSLFPLFSFVLLYLFSIHTACRAYHC